MRTVRLGEVAAIDRVGVDPTTLDPATLYLGLEHIERGGDIIGCGAVGDAALVSTKFRFTDQHLLFGKLRPNLAKIARPTFSGVCSTDILPIRPGSDLGRDYLAHYLRQPEVVQKAAALAAGANLPRLNPAVLAAFDIPLPSIDEQRRIAAILDQADALRAKRRRSMELLDCLSQSTFDAMFAADESPSSRFSDVCSRLTVGVVVRPASYYVPDGVPALRTLNVKPGRIALDDLVRFSPEDNDGPLRKSRLCSGDLVISRTGKAGVAAVVPPHLDGANAIDLIVATPDRARALPGYLEALINSPRGQRLVAGEARGQIQQHFNVGSLKSAEIPVPRLERQQEFVAQVECISARRDAAQRSLRTLDELFASLQARAFSGQLGGP